ncbi:hypothetical protein HQ563_11580, partial [bacterium]|nr:hypothetical protein [bacterium]
MRKAFVLILLLALLFAPGRRAAWAENRIGAPANAGQKVFPYRWVYVSRGLGKDSDVEDIRQIVRTAAKHELNGMVLAAGLDRISLWSADSLRRLMEVKALCEENRVELIPTIFSTGYGGAVLAHNKNLAAGIPVNDALFVVRGREARLVPDPPAQVVNGGFEEFRGNRLKGFGFHDKPGEITFVDTKTVKEGKASLRLEHFGELDPHGHARIMQELKVRPRRFYRIWCWVKTEGLSPTSAFGIQILADGHTLAPYDPRVPATTDWRRIAMAFNSLHHDRVRLYAGLWKGKEGRVWLDDLRIEEVGLMNVLRRPGTPITVRSEDGRTVYREGFDYELIVDPGLNPSRPHREAVPIRLTPSSRIRNGQQLKVSFYHGMCVNRWQVSICMSEPELYEIWREEARLIHRHLQPKKYLLSMDEVRAGGSCAACKARKMTMAKILGDCITKQVAILRGANPRAEVFVWSDMLDPNHNAHGDYYLVEGDFTGSWKYVPKDLVIVCWYHRKREASLKFFSDLGFRTLAGAYYDGNTLENPRGWLASLRKTPGACGI